MIDNPAQLDRLIAKLREALPLPAIMTANLAALVEKHWPDGCPSRRCSVTRVDYSGDEGGIMCKLDFGGDKGQSAFFASITQLLFNAKLPLAREIAAYQKHRIKHLRRLGAVPQVYRAR